MTTIRDPDALDALARSLEDTEWVVLDTEFMREQTYYAQLCLIQLATPTVLACVDPFALPDLDPLLARLYDPALVKVFHSGRQDLELLFDLRGALPAPVFDTRIAAALLGHDEQIGYGALVEAMTGVKLAKGHTRTNWAARPLSGEQLRYAEEDVTYLRDIYPVLCERLSERGRLAWLEEECTRLIDPSLYRATPASLAARVKQGHLLDPAAQGRLRDLLAWRETTARARNLPRNWVVHESDLLALARAFPRSAAALDAVKIARSPRLAQWRDEILEVLAAAEPVDIAHPLWPTPARLSGEQGTLYDELARRIKERAQAEGVNSGLVASRKDITALLLGGDSALRHGWRWIFIGEELLDQVSGRVPR